MSSANSHLPRLYNLVVPSIVYLLVKSKTQNHLLRFWTNRAVRCKLQNWCIREFKHVIERASIISTGKKLNIPELEEDSNLKRSASEFKTLKEMERDHIIEAMECSNFKVSGKNGAAQL